MAELYLGVISGTSADGIDIALLECDSSSSSKTKTRLVAGETRQFEPGLGQIIRRLMRPDEESIDLLGHTDVQLGKAIGAAINDFLQRNRIQSSQISAVGCHGQTLRHRPVGCNPFSLQIGDPNQIVEITGLPVVVDVRRRDMAAGGQGAPLVPAYHELLFRSQQEYRLVLNLGGIANFTCLPSDPSIPIFGFDTGPSNALLDGWISSRLGKPYDERGDWASGAEPDERLVTSMLEDPYFHQAPPKSTGREYFHLDWLAEHLAHRDLDDQVVQSSLTELTVRSVIAAAETWAPDATRLILCGGGRLNAEFVRRLRRLSRLAPEQSESYGVDGDFLEAAAFAWLAKCTIEGTPASRASVTGARGDRVLGGLYRP